MRQQKRRGPALPTRPSSPPSADAKPKKRPRQFAGIIRAMRSSHAGVATPPIMMEMVSMTKKSQSSASGCAVAQNGIAIAMMRYGMRSTIVQPTTKGFLCSSRSV